MTTGVYLLEFVGILIFLVLVHEAGHMVVAKWCGMRVERFSVFFGRPLARFQRGETEYRIGWLPGGGYVKISGMSREEEIPEELVPRAYYSATMWRKIATIAAGPLVNVLVAVICFTLAFWIGVPNAGAPTTRLAQVVVSSPAAAAGMRPGDTLVAVNGQRSTDADVFRRILAARPNKRVTITYSHSGADVTRTVRLTSVKNVNQQVVACDPASKIPCVGHLGVSFELATRREGFFPGIWQGINSTWFVVHETVTRLARSPSQAQSIVGAGAVYTKVASQGLATVLAITGLLSMALALFNLIPIPPLDGGHILIAVVERVKGRSVSASAYERAAVVGFAVILILAVVLIQRDIFHIANGTVPGGK
jgi:regulator of sigma E protease